MFLRSSNRHLKQTFQTIFDESRSSRVILAYYTSKDNLPNFNTNVFFLVFVLLNPSHKNILFKYFGQLKTTQDISNFFWEVLRTCSVFDLICMYYLFTELHFSLPETLVEFKFCNICHENRCMCGMVTLPCGHTSCIECIISTAFHKLHMIYSSVWESICEDILENFSFSSFLKYGRLKIFNMHNFCPYRCINLDIPGKCIQIDAICKDSLLSSCPCLGGDECDGCNGLCPACTPNKNSFFFK